jgi:arylsulfatase A-like enzyme
MVQWSIALATLIASSLDPATAQPGAGARGAHWAIQGAQGQMQGVCNAPGGDVHDVRCCSDTALPGYQQRSGCSIYTESVFHTASTFTGCVSDVDYATAVSTCSVEGARLCSRAEIEANCAQGTGCGHDADLVWTDEVCGDSTSACGDVNARMAAVALECCDEATEVCSGGIIQTCNAGCADVLVPFKDDCLTELQASAGRAAANQVRTAANLCSSTPTAAPSGHQWNVLFIGTDQQRTSTLSCYGNSWAHSPNIDRLAAGGVRFTDAVTVTPVCSPSRTSMLTGVHVPVHGVYENGIDAYDHADSLTPYFDVLKAQGYNTALIGKTHFNPTPATIDHLDAHTGNSDMRGPNVVAADFLETYLVNQTMQWISSLPAGTAGAPAAPWFCYTSMVSPNGPNWVPTGPWSNVYNGVSFPPVNFQNGNIAELPYQTRMLLGLLGHEHNNPPAFPAGQPNMGYIDQPVTPGSSAGRYNYYTQAAYVDYEVGRLLDFLDQRRLTGNTLVIFSSDHGSQMYDHGINNDKHNFLDATLRVPMIMRLPNVIPAGITRRFATTLDIPATILAAAGAAIPNSYQGFDLLTPTAAGLPSPRTVGIACEYRGMAVVTPSWKLAYFPENDEGRFWDRVADPAEQTDLWGSTDAVVVRARTGLLKALLRWRAQQDPISFMQNHLQGQGPTALHVIQHTNGIKGIDAEVRLQTEALQFEHAGTGPGGHRRMAATNDSAEARARFSSMTKEQLVELLASQEIE